MIGFRLLNSEIGNDLKQKELKKEVINMSFRLLNSEIGNDRVGYPKECHMD